MSGNDSRGFDVIMKDFSVNMFKFFFLRISINILDDLGMFKYLDWKVLLVYKFRILYNGLCLNFRLFFDLYFNIGVEFNRIGIVMRYWEV